MRGSDLQVFHRVVYGPDAPHEVDGTAQDIWYFHIQQLFCVKLEHLFVEQLISVRFLKCREIWILGNGLEERRGYNIMNIDLKYIHLLIDMCKERRKVIERQVRKRQV